MDAPATQPSASSATKARMGLGRDLLWAHGLLVAATVIGWPMYRMWRSFLDFQNQGKLFLIFAILAGVGMVVCLTGAMYFLDKPLCQNPQPRWLVRVPLKVYKRVVLLLQLAATAGVIGGLGVLIFGFRVPVPK